MVTRIRGARRALRKVLDNRTRKPYDSHMGAEHDRTDPEYWVNQITPETRELGRRAAERHDGAIEAIKSATPVHPKTGERGTFVRFAGGGTRIRPVYRTSSGKEFFDQSDP